MLVNRPVRNQVVSPGLIHHQRHQKTESGYKVSLPPSMSKKHAKRFLRRLGKLGGMPERYRSGEADSSDGQVARKGTERGFGPAFILSFSAVLCHYVR